MSKIGNTTVRGSWSKVVWDCNVDGKRISLFAERGLDITNAKMREWKKIIEERKIVPTAPFTMLKINSEGRLEGAK